MIRKRVGREPRHQKLGVNAIGAAFLRGAVTLALRDWDDGKAGQVQREGWVEIALAAAFGPQALGYAAVRSIERLPLTSLVDSDYEALGWAWMHRMRLDPHTDYSPEAFARLRSSPELRHFIRIEWRETAPGAREWSESVFRRRDRREARHPAGEPGRKGGAE